MKQRMLNDVALEQLLYFILEQKLNNYLTQMTVLRKNGRQIGITELTKQIFDEKGYAYLQKKNQEIDEIMQTWWKQQRLVLNPLLKKC